MSLPCVNYTFFQPLMKELDEMEKINAKLSAAVEEVTLEHCKKNEVIFFLFHLLPSSFVNQSISFVENLRGTKKKKKNLY